VDLGDLPKSDVEQAKFENFDAGFCCLGTTRKAAGSDEAFRKVDYEYIINVGQAAKEQNCKHFLLVSSIGADKNSWFLYPRTKGETEAKLESLGFPHLSIYRPSVLDRGEDARFVEKLSAPLSNLIPKYRTMPLDLLSRVMIDQCLKHSGEPVQIMENSEIHSYAADHNLMKTE